MERDLRAALGMPSRPTETAPADAAICVAFDASEDAHYWQVRIGTHVVRFPAAACFRYEVRPMELGRADGRIATIDFADVLSPMLLGPLAEAAAHVRSRGTWELRADGMYQYRAVVADDGAIDAATEISVSAAREIDPSFHVGDTIGFEAPMPALHWLVLEWIRGPQLPP